MTESMILAQVVLAGRDAARAVLHTCRIEAYGAESYGREAAAGLCRPWSDLACEAYDGGRFGLLVGSGERADAALAADLIDGRIARLWRLGDGPPRPPLGTALSVPQDPDLRQGQPGFGFEREDFPELRPEDAAAVAALGAEIAALDLASLAGMALDKPRLVVLRAASTARGPIGLAVLFADVVEGRTRPVRCMLAFAGGPNDRHLVLDRAGLAAALAAPWQPRLVSA